MANVLDTFSNILLTFATFGTFGIDTAAASVASVSASASPAFSRGRLQAWLVEKVHALLGSFPRLAFGCTKRMVSDFYSIISDNVPFSFLTSAVPKECSTILPFSSFPVNVPFTFPKA